MDVFNRIFGNAFHIYLLVAELLFSPFLERKKHFKICFPAMVSLYILLPYVIDLNALTIEWFPLKYLFLFACSLAVLYVNFKMSLKELIFYGCAAYIVQHCCDTVGRMIYGAFFGIEMSRMWIMYILEIGCAAVGYTIFGIIINRAMKKYTKVDVDNVPLICMVVITLIVVCAMSLWHTQSLLHGNNNPRLGAMYDLICCILLFCLQFGLFERGALRERSRIVETMLNTVKTQQKIQKETTDVINRKCHDLKHQISVLRYIQDSETKDKSIAEIEKAVLIYDSFAKTGNAALDMILTQKSLYAEKYGVKLLCIADGSALEFMDDSDVYSLFGNILDNAIEAVCNVDELEKRVINLNVVRKQGATSIHSENYAPVDLCFEDGLPRTTKSDKNIHGFGMESIRYITQSYGGTMTVSEKAHLFEINIVFFR